MKPHGFVKIVASRIMLSFTCSAQIVAFKLMSVVIEFVRIVVLILMMQSFVPILSLAISPAVNRSIQCVALGLMSVFTGFVQIVALGFEPKAAQTALRKYRNNIQRAVDDLIKYSGKLPYTSDESESGSSSSSGSGQCTLSKT